MQDGGDADLGLEAVAAKLEQGGTGRRKEQLVKGTLVLGDERVEQMRHGENQVIVTHRQQALSLSFQPLIRLRSLTARTGAVTAPIRDKVILGAVLATANVAP